MLAGNFVLHEIPRSLYFFPAIELGVRGLRDSYVVSNNSLNSNFPRSAESPQFYALQTLTFVEAFMDFSMHSATSLLIPYPLATIASLAFLSINPILVRLQYVLL